MRKILLALGIMALICTPAMAGPNANGAIVVHTDDLYEFDDAPCDWPIAGPCPNLLTQIDTILPSPGNIIFFLAAFVPATVSDVATVYFGVNWDYTTLKVGSTAKGPCGGTGLEAPDAGWPGNTNGVSGNTWGMDVAQTSDLFRFYWFGLRPKTGSTVPNTAFFCSAINPTGGYASFISPALEVDNIDQFGCVRWHIPGYNTCPHGVEIRGACCDHLGACLLELPVDCLPPRIYKGDNTSCFPENPCEQPGACCVPDYGVCTFGLLADCAQGNVYMGVGVTCEPINPCPAKGACCVPISGTCYWLYEADCQVPPNTFMPGLTCEPTNPCPVEAQGACCVLELGLCVMTYAVQCVPPNTFHADWVCDVDPEACPGPVATQPSTWGQIKANYR